MGVTCSCWTTASCMSLIRAHKATQALQILCQSLAMALDQKLINLIGWMLSLLMDGPLRL